MPNAALESALALAALGLRVFPLVAGKKMPAFKGWKDKATVDTVLIHEWYTGPFRGYGVGVATGKGLMVIDADVKGGQPGLQSLEQLLDEHGLDYPPPTLVVDTPSGGRHVYLKVADDKPVHTVLGTLPGFPGIDIKGEGGFVAAPGSVDHRGVPYKIVR